MIIGMVYKIIPFLAWQHRYSDLVGLRPVPPATQLLDERFARMGFFLLHAGVLATVGGLILGSAAILQAGTLVLGLAGVAFAVVLVRIYRHLLPQLTPLPDVTAGKI